MLSYNIRPVTQPHWVPRPRLFDALDSSLSGRLAFLYAPSGYGKTTLAASWASRLEQDHARRVGWVSCGPSLTDVNGWLEALAGALEMALAGEPNTALASSGWRTRLTANSPTGHGLQHGMSVYVGEVAAASVPLLLVVDDIHLTRFDRIAEALKILIERQPPNLFLLLLTAGVPPIPLEGLISKNLAVELTAADLACTSSEVAQIFNALGVEPLPPASTSHLLAGVEAAAAGIQVAALGWRVADGWLTPPEQDAFLATLAGLRPPAFVTLMDKALGRLPQEDLRFMLVTAALGRFGGEMLSALTTRNNAPWRLQQLYTAGYFLEPFDTSLGWFRYFPLFGDILRIQLPTALALQVQRRAALWFASRGDLQEASRLALLSGDRRLAAQMALGNSPHRFRRGEYLSLMRDLEPLIAFDSVLSAWYQQAALALGRTAPVETFLQEKTAESDQANAGLSVFMPALKAGLAALRGDTAGAAVYAEAALSNSANSTEPASVVPGMLSSVTLGHALHTNGRLDQATAAFLQALEMEKSLPYPALAVEALGSLGSIHLDRGELDLAASHLACGLARLGAVHSTATRLVSAVVLRPLAYLAYEQNRINDARRHVEELLDLGMLTQNLPVQAGANHLAALISFAENDLEGALRHTGRHDLLRPRLIHAPDSLRLGVEVQAMELRLLLAEKEPLQRKARLADVSRWLRSRDLDPQKHLHPGREPEELILAMWLTAQPEPAQASLAVSRFAGLAGAAREQGRFGAALGYEVWQIRAMLATGQPHDDLLGRALAFGNSRGYLRTFLDAGPAFFAALRSFPPDASLDSYIRLILSTTSTTN